MSNSDDPTRAWVRRQREPLGTEQAWRALGPDPHPPLTCCRLHDEAAYRAQAQRQLRREDRYAALLWPLVTALLLGLVALAGAAWTVRQAVWFLRYRGGLLMRGDWRGACRVPGRVRRIFR